VLLRYVPEQKWVARLRAEAMRPSGTTIKRRVVVRAAAPAVCAAVKERHAALRRLSQQPQALFSSPRVVGYEGRPGLVAVKWTHGKSLLELVQEEESPRAVMRDLARALISLHASGVPDLPALTVHDQQAQLDDAVADLSAACPAWRERVEALAAVLRERLSRLEGRAPATLHNDLHARQVRLERGRFTFLDLERMAVGDPLIDVADLTAQLHMLGDRTEFLVDTQTAGRSAAELVRAWEAVSDKPIDATRFRCYVILSLLKLARGMMRHLRPGWRPLVLRCIEQAGVELARTDREATLA
jgi:aminoglycoside phosphotransferase (APT) family kinase protein